ncbi:MAG: hypothetical protein EBX52_05295 [Proteobacteria bacterium]|nr:hypothetical protein [Pseudomonadota bacterium]
MKDPVYRYITSTPFNPTQDQKKKVYQLTRERLCLELQIFKTENRLDFPLDCMNQPGTFPELSLEVIKNAGIEKDDFIDPSGVRVMSSRIISILRFFIRVGDRRVLFKEENRVIVQERAGPKLVEGDMLTPEGRYDLKSGTTESKYFISTHIDYENWRDRKTLLSAEVPNRNARKIGGEIKIHGTGGSDGCVSLPNSEAALVAVWTNGSKNPSIDLYPQEMTDQNVSALLQKPEGRIYGDFWKATQTAYLDARRPDKVLGPEAKTIDDLLR